MHTGDYSLIASQYADLVISLDSDAICIDRLYRNCRADSITNIVPLVANLLNPSPNMGWMEKERSSLFERVRGGTFLALALVHHIAITGNVPLAEFFSLLRRIADCGVAEWVDKSDPMVRTLLQNRMDVFVDYEWEKFKAILEIHFTIEGIETFRDGERRLCLVGPKA